MKEGTLVYRVVEFDFPTNKPHTWKVEAVEVERASSRQIKLKKAFTGIGLTLYRPDALGRTFFETPLQAIRAFIVSRRLELESLERKRVEQERAIAWALNQPGMV